jgi:4a-hydroxytetrahydrobiopterin dehydratase
MPPTKLSDLEMMIHRLRGDVLQKTFTRPTFADGIAFIGRIADAAETMDHHPDIDIRYTKITCSLSSHDAGGITQRDLDLAAQIEALA